MKKILFSLSFIVLASAAFSQIPNSGFDNWQQENKYFLRSWQTLTGDVQRTAVSGANYSARLNNVKSSDNSTLIFLSNRRDFDQSGFPQGGFPYTDEPDSIKVTMRYDLAPGDTGFIIALLRKNVLGNNLPISINIIRVAGTQSTLKTFSYPVSFSLAVAPDTAMLAISTANLDTLYGNGYIEVDKIWFTDNTGAELGSVPNGDFNNWDTVVLEEPQGWYTTNRAMLSLDPVTRPRNVFKTLDRVSGAYAIYLENDTIFTGDSVPGVAVTANTDGLPDQDLPSFEISSRIQSIEGYMKYLPGSGDTAYMLLNVFNGSTLVGSGELYEGKTISSWTKFRFDVEYDPTFTGIPDSATVLVASARLENPIAALSTRLYVDELSLNAFPTSVQNLSGADLQPILYPNPVSGSARVGFIAEQNGTVKLEITDLSGRVLQFSEHSAVAGINKIALNTAEITPGVYLLHLRLNEQSTVIRFIKQL